MADSKLQVLRENPNRIEQYKFIQLKKRKSKYQNSSYTRLLDSPVLALQHVHPETYLFKRNQNVWKDYFLSKVIRLNFLATFNRMEFFANTQNWQ